MQNIGKQCDLSIKPVEDIHFKCKYGRSQPWKTSRNQVSYYTRGSHYIVFCQNKCTICTLLKKEM
jgi:hypothetical protein